MKAILTFSIALLSLYLLTTYSAQAIKPPPYARASAVMKIPLSPSDYRTFFDKYQKKVVKIWHRCQKPILDGKSDFDVSIPEGAVGLHNLNPTIAEADSLISYRVTGVVEGVFSFKIKNNKLEGVVFEPGSVAISPAYLKLNISLSGL